MFVNAKISVKSSVSSSKEDMQNCPQCGFLIGVVAGSKDAICNNCGYKDPCCE